METSEGFLGVYTGTKMLVFKDESDFLEYIDTMQELGKNIFDESIIIISKNAEKHTEDIFKKEVLTYGNKDNKPILKFEADTSIHEELVNKIADRVIEKLNNKKESLVDK